ncbi:MAG: LON peptidase substrate-binding domain-containing protein, partial [Gemmatimonadota bacterium]
MATLIRTDESVDIPDTLPVVALRDLVFFPYIVLPLLIGRPRSSAALEEVGEGGLLVLLAQTDPGVEEPGVDDLNRVGTVARAVQVRPLTDGTSRVVLEGIGRVRITELDGSNLAFRGRVERFVERESDPPEGVSIEVEALARRAGRLYEEYAHLHDRIPDEITLTLGDTLDRVRLAHLMSGHMLLPPPEKQELLEAPTISRHFELLAELLER